MCIYLYIYIYLRLYIHAQLYVRRHAEAYHYPWTRSLNKSQPAARRVDILQDHDSVAEAAPGLTWGLAWCCGDVVTRETPPNMSRYWTMSIFRFITYKYHADHFCSLSLSWVLFCI